jgi:Rrf2 family cysteine metabolism transcriptional repressor
MVELALHYDKSHIQIKDIAQAHHIPQHYLEQLLVILKKNGFVKSFRGNQGGYSLADNPNRIKVLDILQSLEGNLEIIPSDKIENALAFFWNSIQNKFKEELDITLNELILKKRSFLNQFTYVI